MNALPPGLSPFATDMWRLLKPFAGVAAVATLIGSVGGLATAALLEQINSALHGSAAISVSAIAGLAVLAVFAVGGHTVAGVLNSVTGQRVVAALRKDVSLRIMGAPIAAVERMKSHRLQAILNEDIDTISDFTSEFAGHASAFAVTAGCAIYLFRLSPVLFLVSALALAVGIWINFAAARAWSRNFEKARAGEDELQKHYRSVVEGAKELRLNRMRRAQVHGMRLSGAADLVARLKARALGLFWAAEGTNSAIFFLVVVWILAARPSLGIDAQVVSGFIIVLLFVKGPIEELAALLPFLSQAQVAFRRIARLSAEFRKEPHAAGPVQPAFLASHIELRQARYRFEARQEGAKPFEVGPIDLRLRRGETLFIVGGNGSGKTTLVKLLLGLYQPSEGRLLLDGVPVDDRSCEAYRGLCSAIFSDYHLFDELVAQDAEHIRCAGELMERLGVADKVQLVDGMFSTTDVSTGQRKRLALVHAWLEDRPVVMFDEWAADQDPEFRSVFYRELLPELKREGKTLIVVSHDDRYFDVADRVIRMSAGRIVEEFVPPGKPKSSRAFVADVR